MRRFGRVLSALRDAVPDDTLTVEVTEYAEGKWQLKFFCQGPSYEGKRLAGSVVTNKVWAFQLTEALRSIDPSFRVIVKGRVDEGNKMDL